MHSCSLVYCVVYSSSSGRADEGHVALQDIEQLRQFIKFQAAHDLAARVTRLSLSAVQPPVLSAPTTIERNL